MSYQVHYKRVYEPASEADGARVLVDRLWPRGMRKDALVFSEWMRDLAPSTQLRRAWHGAQLDAQDFASKYSAELRSNIDALLPLMRLARQGPVTLLTTSREPAQSHLPVLAQILVQELQREDDEADGREPSSPVCYR